MKNKRKILLVIFLSFLVFYTVKKNSISESRFNLLVLEEMNDIIKDYYNKLEANDGGKVFETKYLYNYYTSRYSEEICTDKTKLKNVITENLKKEFWIVY
jgi:hypothetical protein